ncbi:hypothetical protein GPECTOR_8g220 [Gonium pectorale]|uniref:Endonuclease/exonuclease/phosphatase domain-containing protein n=1 Tax=Gonium pectorale TaxID=33097 RepID=A0A150GSL3_GONPE|nr:hypothetical protein GPECTOR_8g220 [Gonium pectorale]|eukprot:KXZ52837.1 hypothetical protein GPECTOR_8g220 [Gonium pectorale]
MNTRTSGSIRPATIPLDPDWGTPQVSAIVSEVPPDSPLLLAGDTNMRDQEDSVPGELGLRDAWLEAGSPPGARWTWDTHVNRYYQNGHRYTARYDRILYRGCTVTELAVAGNTPASREPGHFLSDHFALIARVTLH